MNTIPADLQCRIWRCVFSDEVLPHLQRVSVGSVWQYQQTKVAYSGDFGIVTSFLPHQRVVLRFTGKGQDGWGNFWALVTTEDYQWYHFGQSTLTPYRIVTIEYLLQYHVKRGSYSKPTFCSMKQLQAVIARHDPGCFIPHRTDPRWPERLMLNPDKSSKT